MIDTIIVKTQGFVNGNIKEGDKTYSNVHLRSTEAMPGGNFIESSHLSGRGHLIDLIRIFENENPGLPMRVDHGRMIALAQIEGMMAVVDDENRKKI